MPRYAYKAAGPHEPGSPPRPLLLASARLLVLVAFALPFALQPSALRTLTCVRYQAVADSHDPRVSAVSSQLASILRMPRR